ncbi:MAG: hypothetical protein IJ013_08635 [Bacteroidaceae bacterium]|nr:hypothetical protein [Bacteroidaceae bacterium]
MDKIFHYIHVAVVCLLAVVAPTLLVSCDDDESYTTSPMALLEFSTDTVRFDTVFTTIGSSTQVFKVYNRGGESLMLPSIRLAGGGATGFRVNVDGMSGTEFADVELRNGDSLFVFVEVTVDPRDEDNPFLLRDSLIFALQSGLYQQVQLEAYGQDMIVLRGQTFARDTILTGERPYVVYDSLVVDSGVTLRLTEGARLYFHSGGFMRVHGTLRAEGSLEHPIVFRGDRLDNMFDYLPYDRLDNQWGGIILSASSYDNYLGYTDIHSGGWGVRCDSSDVVQNKLTIENSVIHNVAGDALSAVNARLWVGNTELTNAGHHCLKVRGGDVQVFFSTLANFYPWAYRGAALSLSNEWCPLTRADFRNCIITGYSSNELMLWPTSEPDSITFNYRFDHCLLTIPADSIRDDRYANVRCDSVEHDVSRITNFPLIDTDIFYYDFSLDSLSQAVGAASADDARLFYPLDRLGYNRLEGDEAPDAGARERAEEDSPEE